jgi:hypothetical protein
MKAFALAVVASSVLLFAGGCGGSPDSPAAGDFPTSPYVTVASETGEHSVEVRTSPQQPLDRGLASVLYTITGPDRAPKDGLGSSRWFPGCRRWRMDRRFGRR